MKLLLYCTKAKPYLYGMYSGFETRYGYHTTNDKNVFNAHNVLNGKIVGECDFEVDKIEYKHIKERDKFGILHNESWYEYRGINVAYYECDLTSRSGFDTSDKLFDFLFNYLADKDGYSINIKNLKIFNTPKRLDEVYYKSVYSWGITYEIGYHEMHKAPQNMRYVYDKEGKEKKIIIPVSPEEMCRIANKEQTVLIRRNVLKEMK